MRRYDALRRLPRPSIIVANHNSHLDTIVLFTMLPLPLIRHVRPVAAAEYFLKNPLLAWFALRVMGIVPIMRAVAKDADPLAECSFVLQQGGILIFFPEGTRGEPERFKTFKNGIAHLARRHPDVPIMPVYMHGLGKALPKGEVILVPFFCDVFVGEQMDWHTHGSEFMRILDERMRHLADEGNFATWD